jgi:hypothetical protein
MRQFPPRKGWNALVINTTSTLQTHLQDALGFFVVSRVRQGRFLQGRLPTLGDLHVHGVGVVVPASAGEAFRDGNQNAHDIKVTISVTERDIGG